MIGVLFVCLGNICRSPMAEAVFRHLLKEDGLDGKIFVDSAGTGSWHVGEPPHRGTRKVLEKYRIDYSGLRARQIGKEDFQRFRYIICMDSSNLQDVNRMIENKEGLYVARLLDFLPEMGTVDVPDPYYSGNFDEVYELVAAGCRRLLSFIREREGI